MKLAEDDDGTALFAAGRMSFFIGKFVSLAYRGAFASSKDHMISEMPGESFDRMLQARQEYDLRVIYGRREFGVVPKEPSMKLDEAKAILGVDVIPHDLNDTDLVKAVSGLTNLSEKDQAHSNKAVRAMSEFGSITHVHRRHLRRILNK
jgi:hypothetical protein